MRINFMKIIACVLEL